MKLYQVEKCPFAHRVRIALEEKKLKYEVAYFASRQRPRELEALSPDARSPTLFDDDGTAVWDSLVVCEYLEDRYVDTPLLPRDPAGRARARLLINEAEKRVTPLEREFKGGGPPDGPALEQLLGRLHAALEPWEARFRTQPFSMGKDFGLADIVLFTPLVAIARALGDRRALFDERSALAAFRDRVASRPSTAH